MISLCLLLAWLVVVVCVVVSFVLLVLLFVVCYKCCVYVFASFPNDCFAVFWFVVDVFVGVVLCASFLVDVM